MTYRGPHLRLGLLAVVLVAAAARAADTPDFPNPVGDSRAIVIVPLEAPPLAVTAGVRLDGAIAANTGLALTYVGDPNVVNAGRTLMLVSGIVMLATLPEQARHAAIAAADAEALLNSKDAWVPTVALAQEARALLVESGVTGVRVSDQVRPIPGVADRQRTFSMHNWYGPVKDWYALDATPFSYGRPEVAPGERVLEVGLGNYELSSGSLLLYVSTKLVDPATGRTLARARKYVYPNPGDPQALFAGDASAFKQAFADAARPALRDDLRKIGLLAR